MMLPILNGFFLLPGAYDEFDLLSGYGGYAPAAAVLGGVGDALFARNGASWILSGDTATPTPLWTTAPLLPFADGLPATPLFTLIRRSGELITPAAAAAAAVIATPPCAAAVYVFLPCTDMLGAGGLRRPSSGPGRTYPPEAGGYALLSTCCAAYASCGTPAPAWLCKLDGPD